MEREKINLDSISRIIQQKNNLGEAYMVDNRSNQNQNLQFVTPLQRVSEEEEDSLQGKFDTPLQKVEDEETIQGKFESPVQRVSDEDEDTLQGKFEKPIQKKNETGMPDNLKAGIERLSGFSMDDVRVHYNSSKPATVHALAYTQGTDIHVAPGQEKHLPHEAWHVAQQMADRVSPTTSINGMPVNDNAALEHEAEVMGEKAIQCKKNQISIINNSMNSGNVIQCGRISQPNELGLSEEGKRDAQQAFGIDIGRDHIIPYEYISKFINYMLEFLSKNEVEKHEIITKWNFWLTIARETKKKNDPNTSKQDDEDVSDVTNDPSLLWMPGNIFISWKNRKIEGPGGTPLFIQPGDIDRVDDAHNGFDKFALDSAGVDPQLKNLYITTSKLMSQESYTPDEVITILDNLIQIATIPKAYETKSKDWVTVENPSYNPKKMKKKNSADQSDKQYLSYYNPVPGFRVRDCGSFGNNCLLLSLGISGNYAAIRQSVRSYEIGTLKNDRVIGGLEVLRTYDSVMTSEDSFLNPETLFPVLQRRGELYVDVWIFNLAINSWVHWNGRELRYTEDPHRSAYGSTSMFLLYNGINHYQRLIYEG